MPRSGVADAAALLLAPALCYACTEAVAGGLRPMLQQMLHARPVYGTALVSVLWHGGAQVSLLVIAATILCVLETRWAPESQGHRIAALAAHGALTAIVVGLLLFTRTDPNDAWGRSLLLLLVVVVGWQSVRDRQIDRLGLVMIAVAWMTSLSWGYPTPRLVAGSVALLLLERLWRMRRPLPLRLPPRAVRTFAAITVATSLAVMTVAINERALINSVDAGRDEAVEQMVPDLRGITTDLSTAALIRNVAACRARFPARWTAVLPGPAVVYPVMKLTNPFSVDWVYPPELRGSGNRLVEDARRLDTEGNYLVLVAPPTAGVANPVLDRMVGELTGARTRCGTFTAIYG